MQSSFSRAYDRQVDAKGFITINYQAQRFGARGTFWAGWLMLWAGIPASCALTSPIVLLTSKRNEMITYPLWMLAASLILIFVSKKCVKTVSALEIQPNVGLVFEGKQLPYSEIDDIGTASDAQAKSYVYANTNGREVKITKYVPIELADAIKKEIMQEGGHWTTSKTIN
jgi:hypothetical protein